ncbi:hyaluronan-binding protein 2-like isoform X2 [Acipenser ruthenus]|uniref:hyaluronan-binding protein 2-like isoform X2 n=1 Tax=Acipenser ruthenus TaxID=7906 RepID=UPI002741AF0B|nr:hyaluronan-binding protein 2-like isoform X2 [Acipenser ruthenus]
MPKNMSFEPVRLALCITLLHLSSSFAVLPVVKDTVDEADYDAEESDYGPADTSTVLDWLYDLVGTEVGCDPNPCQNNGVCEERRGRYKCHCPEPFSGRNCHKVNAACKKAKCGKGECVITSTPPYYHCKCRYPFQPPHCKKPVAVCQPNPCQNGGRCSKDKKNTFSCACQSPFRGEFCEIRMDDCYENNGETYSGKVNHAEDGSPCLHWNSYLVYKGDFNTFRGIEESQGSHRYCRNPDSEIKPWCFVKINKKKVTWKYCDIRQCEPSPSKPAVRPDPVPEPPKAPSEELPTDPPKGPAAVAPSEMFATCGIGEPKAAWSRIYGGIKAIPRSHPWQASIQSKHPNNIARHYCGGILIKSCWVLTAAHCVVGIGSRVQVVLGGQDLQKKEPEDQTFDVEKSIVHGNYTDIGEAVYNDIALLKLKPVGGQCAKETRYVKTACLPDSPFADGTECSISGWGKTEKGDISNQLLDAQVLLISQERCKDRNVYGSLLDNSMFCAGNLEGGPDSCQGDSGGPLTCERDGKHYAYGIVSWGDQCGLKNKPGVYTRVTKFVDWINSKLLHLKRYPLLKMYKKRVFSPWGLTLFIALLPVVSSSFELLDAIQDLTDTLSDILNEYSDTYLYGDDYGGGDAAGITDAIDWLYDYIDTEKGCEPNPCQNNGTCEPRGGTYRCACPEPYTGQNCQKVTNFCKSAKCGMGDCVITSTAPYYECKCRHPYQQPNCRKVASTCHPNPCRNGGACTKGRTRSTFTCTCPQPFRGDFCEVGKDDCYEGNGETYRGNVSSAEDGSRCLYWSSYQVLKENISVEGGLGSHRYCRNPDSDIKPWCFIKTKRNRLKWKYCDVTQCGLSLPAAPEETLRPR